MKLLIAGPNSFTIIKIKRMKMMINNKYSVIPWPLTYFGNLINSISSFPQYIPNANGCATIYQKERINNKIALNNYFVF